MPPPEVVGPPSVVELAPPVDVVELVVAFPVVPDPVVPKPLELEPVVAGPVVVGVPVVVLPIVPVVGPAMVPVVGPVLALASALELDFGSSLLQAVAQTTASVTEVRTETCVRVSLDIARVCSAGAD